MKAALETRNFGARDSLRTRRSLLSRIKNWQDQESWSEFYRLYQGFVYGVARKAGLSQEESKEAVQETFCQVAKNIERFRYDPAAGSFKSWLIHTARWHIAEQFRRRAKLPFPIGDGEGAAAIERIPDVAENWIERVSEEEWRRSLSDAALDRIKKQVRPKQYQMFYLYVIKETPLTRICSLLGVSRGQVYLARHRIGRLFAAEVRRLRREYR